MPNQVFVISIDKAAFYAEVKKYVDLSPVFKEYQDVRKLDWPEALRPPQLWTTVKEINELVAASCAAVEIAKQKIIETHTPDGVTNPKFDKTIALDVAVDLICEVIQFKGFVGSIVNKIWRPLLNLLVSMYVTQQQSDWLVLAFQILKLAMAA